MDMIEVGKCPHCGRALHTAVKAEERMVVQECFGCGHRKEIRSAPRTNLSEVRSDEHRAVKLSLVPRVRHPL